VPGRDELAGRRAAKTAPTLDEVFAVPADREQQMGLQRARDGLSVVDRVIRFWAEGGCRETGGAHVPDRLAAPLVQAVTVGLAVMEQRNGGRSLSGAELAAWCALVARSPAGPSPVTVASADPQRIGSAEAARLIGCSRRHVARLVRQRWLDAERVGPVLVLRRRQVLEYAEGREGGHDSSS